MSSLCQEYTVGILSIWKLILPLRITSLYVTKEYNLFAQLDNISPQCDQTGLFLFCPNILALCCPACDPVQTTTLPVKISTIRLITQKLVWDSRDSYKYCKYWFPSQEPILGPPVHAGIMKPQMPHSPTKHITFHKCLISLGAMQKSYLSWVDSFLHFASKTSNKEQDRNIHHG